MRATTFVLSTVFMACASAPVWQPYTK